jgi:hypothetical protein
LAGCAFPNHRTPANNLADFLLKIHSGSNQNERGSSTAVGARQDRAPACADASMAHVQEAGKA